MLTIGPDMLPGTGVHEAPSGDVTSIRQPGELPYYRVRDEALEMGASLGNAHCWITTRGNGTIEKVFESLAHGLELERKRTGGLPTKIGDHWIVHHEHGKPCPVCGDDLRRVSYESHEVTYCPTCQTGGKILADRRMSRLIR